MHRDTTGPSDPGPYARWGKRCLDVGVSLAALAALAPVALGVAAYVRATMGTPVLFRHEHHSPEDVGAIYRAADVCVVSSLHGGMNLVAKEFIAARADELGVLVLSQFTGAARALADVVPVNPFAPDEFAAAIDDSLRLPPDEQRRRMRNLRAEVLSHTVYDWAGTLLSEACRLADVRRG